MSAFGGEHNDPRFRLSRERIHRAGKLCPERGNHRVRFLRAIKANMRDALGNGEIKTFVTHDFFLIVVHVIAQSGIRTRAGIVNTVTISTVRCRQHNRPSSVSPFSGQAGTFFALASAINCVLNVQTLDVATLPKQCSLAVKQLGTLWHPLSELF